MTRHLGQTLIFDADDTLWENNVIFERVQDDFVDWLAHPTREPARIRELLAEIDEANVVTHGYGSAVFLRTLAECYERLLDRPLDDAGQARLDGFAARFATGRVELIPDVAEVLDELGARHELHLLTKGATDEQQRKIDASGLARHFAAVDIVPVKEPQTYRTLVAERGLDPSRTWMIGNSPRSDVLAARLAGLRAVFVPNANTWAHEHAELDPADEGILHITAFAELTRWF